jgi:formate dehydrogenase (NADP+) alpha subunit
VQSITLSIDDQRISCPPGTSILEAAQSGGIVIPTLCHHPQLKPFGACRLCLVEEQKSGRIMASCVTPAAAEMVIKTDSKRVLNHRRNILRLMMAEHPESCLVCNKGNRCRLRLLAAQLGIGDADLYPMPHPAMLEQANPFIVRDLSKCIMCGQCIRADHELVDAGAIDFNARGFAARPATVYCQGLEKTNCTFCGTCISVCPTGALSAKDEHWVGTPEGQADSVCGFCGMGCKLSLGISDNTVVDVNPASEAGTVNGATLCVRGHFGHDFLNSPQRLTQPLIRENGDRFQDPQISTDWDTALDAVAKRFKAISETHGPESIAFYGSSKCTNEENYLFQKMARTCFGTNNIDNGGYLQGRNALKVLHQKTDGRFRPRPLDGLENAEALMILGADPAHSVPVLSYSVKRAAQKGVPILTINGHATDFDKKATACFHLPADGFSDVPFAAFINGFSAELVRQNGYSPDFIEEATTGYPAFYDALSSMRLDQVAQKAGTTPAALTVAAELFFKKRITFVLGSGILNHRSASAVADALINLALLTGSIDNLGLPVYVLARENNFMGAWDMGCVPDGLPGPCLLSADPIRERLEAAWQAKIAPEPGLDLAGMLGAAAEGRLKALYIMGENPLRSLPRTDLVDSAFAKLDYLVVQDILVTETTRIADVVLPGAAFSEKGGSFTNLESRIQGFEPAVAPPGEARPDWQILSDLMARLGQNPSTDGLATIVDEIRQTTPSYADMQTRSYTAWVNSGQDAPIANIAEAPLWCFATPAVLPESDQKADGSINTKDAAYPLTAHAVSRRFHLGSGTRTSASKRIRKYSLSAAAAEMGPEQLYQLGLQKGAIVKITSPSGEISLAVKSNPRIAPGQIHIPVAVDDNSARNLFGAQTENKTSWPTCRVRAEKNNPQKEKSP